ncbi:MAG: hypothetical protein ISS19_17875 [Bacteroidales bacterium]|nr:hypothetical protein [Bacteroidales bacterium]
MSKFTVYFNYSLLCVIYLGLFFSGISFNQSGKPGSTYEHSGDEIALEKQQGYIIIPGGGKTVEDAENTIDRFNLRTFPFEYSVDFPKILKSDSIEGLNPGFQICVLGFCKDQAAAEKIRDLVNITSEEVVDSGTPFDIEPKLISVIQYGRKSKEK